MLRSEAITGMLGSRIATIRRHISPAFHSALASSSSTPWDGDAIERMGIQVEQNVRRALSEGLPVVALESTIISHGMPYPQNLQTAKEVENIVRKNGATPATIAILGGVPYIGLTEKELEHLARLGPNAVKTSTRDIAQVIARGADGATTVSGTMFFAAKNIMHILQMAISKNLAEDRVIPTTGSGFSSLAGIRVFVTGGLGGVHRGGETTLDISADLTELGRIPIAVVCAGVKSILDIPRTLEYLECGPSKIISLLAYTTEGAASIFALTGFPSNSRMLLRHTVLCREIEPKAETQGVTVVGYGTDEFPAFFTPKSGCKAPCRVDSPEDCAAIIATNLRYRLLGGILIGVPIPQEYAADAEPIEEAIQTALEETRQKNIQGSAVTPYILKQVNALSSGASLAANIELIKNNACIGTRIAVALTGQLKSDSK